MSLEKMKKTPTGWGTAYSNVNTIACKRKSGTKIECILAARPPVKEEKVLTGIEIQFMDIDRVRYEGEKTFGYMVSGDGDKKIDAMICGLDGGIIYCQPMGKK